MLNCDEVEQLLFKLGMIQLAGNCKAKNAIIASNQAKKRYLEEVSVLHNWLLLILENICIGVVQTIEWWFWWLHWSQTPILYFGHLVKNYVN